MGIWKYATSHDDWRRCVDASHHGTGRLLLRHSLQPNKEVWRKTAALVMNIDDMEQASQSD